MRPLARVSRLKLPSTPELAPLRMPAEALSARRLIAHARAMGTQAAKHASVFVAAGSPDDFAERLSVAADAYSDAITARDQILKMHAGATEALAMRLVRVGKLRGRWMGL